MKTLVRKFKIFVLKYIFGGEVEMAMVYVLLLVKGLKQYKDIPMLLREQVNQLLIDMELEYLIEV